MKIHRREALVREAERALQDAWHSISKEVNDVNEETKALGAFLVRSIELEEEDDEAPRLAVADHSLQGRLMDAWVPIRHPLTYYERLRVMASLIGDALGTTAKYGIREERHGKTSKPGGLE